jgi:hypothetical protein
VDGAGRALCARSWTNSSESGAAGSCFFLLPAGVGYTCASSGAVNMIDASFAPAAANRAPALAPDGLGAEIEAAAAQTRAVAAEVHASGAFDTALILGIGADE